ncbi:MAG: hypothetical protein JWP32_2298 [Schumannella sp.]|nr:hypothetical protein [Schumannella sp.]
MSARTQKGQELVIGAEPRVDLLPPEVHAQVKMRALRRILGLVVVLALVAVGGGYFIAQLRASMAQSSLSAAQQETLDLLAEQAQYAEAADASDTVETALGDRSKVLSNEVLWADLVDSIRALLPAGATIDSATMTARAPWEPEMETQGPLRAPRVATINFVVKSASLLDTPSIVRALSDLPGFADATPDRVDRNDTTFNTTITLNLDADIAFDRYADEKEQTK